MCKQDNKSMLVASKHNRNIVHKNIKTPKIVQLIIHKVFNNISKINKKFQLIKTIKILYRTRKVILKLIRERNIHNYKISISKPSRIREQKLMD